MAVVVGKVALITGGLGGIGLAMVKALLENGAKGVVIVDFCEEKSHKIIEELNASFGTEKTIFIKTDVTNKQELEKAFEKAVTNYKQLDIVVNNAGIVEEVQWEKTIAVNLTAVIQGSYLAQQKFLPKYKSGEEGVIVNTASILGLNTIDSLPIYCAAKHGVVALGEALGGDVYYKQYKVRVLTICPGVVRTPMVTNPDSKKIVLADKAKEDIRTLNSVIQSPECVGKALIEILKKGKNGSLWVTEDAEPAYEVVIPDRKLMRKQ